MTDIGFTGTQNGMTWGQRSRLADKLSHYAIGTRFHHGCCIGADAGAHIIARGYRYYIILHPPLNPAKRAYCNGADEEREPLEYLARNHAIVNECGLLIAAPKSPVEELRSGTWATVRYARKRGVPIWFVLPDGTARAG